MGYLDHCKTQQGRKLLHRWIDQPLTHLEDILTRQEAVSELTDHPILHLHEKFEAYSKLEKRLGDIYHWISRNSERGKLILTRSINYEK
jgi:DNA mismatch repair ATPase MutS